MQTYAVELKYGDAYYRDTIEAESEQEAIEEAGDILLPFFLEYATATPIEDDEA